MLWAPIGKAQTPEPSLHANQTQQTKTRRVFALPRTNLGWWSVLIATGFFVCMRLLPYGGALVAECRRQVPLGALNGLRLFGRHERQFP
jgi:hypothetical protein